MHNANNPEAREDERTVIHAMRRTERFIMAAIANGKMETTWQKVFWKGLRVSSQVLAGSAMENVRR